MSETDNRHYFTVELVDVSEEWDRHIEQHEAHDTEGVQKVLDLLEAEDKLQWPNEIRLRRTRRLDAPLTDEEEQELKNWIAGFEETDEDSETLSDEEVDQEIRDMNEKLEAEMAEQEAERWSDEDFGMHEPKEGQDVVEALKEMHDDRDYEFRVTDDE